MPHGTGIGVYPYGEVADAREGNEVSSTFEGRHLTFVEAQITGHINAFPTKGYGCVVGESIVGVALNTATAVGDYVTIDTEGIFLMSVVALNPAAVAVVAGDELFINKTTGIISNNMNKATHCHFGYALGGVAAGQTAIISVKVHWDPDDASEEMVGVTGTPYVNDEASKLFRGFFYDAGGGGIVEGERMELNITAPVVTACVDYRRLRLDGAQDIITGRSSVMEGRLDISAGAGVMATMSVLVLDFANLSDYSINNIQSSYIALRDRSALAAQMRNVFNFMDITPQANSGQYLFEASSGDLVTTHTLRFMAGGVDYWICCRNAN